MCGMSAPLVNKAGLRCPPLPPNALTVKARTSVTGRGRTGRMESMVHAAPVPVIQHVLHDLHTAGAYQGFPQLGELLGIQ